MGTSESKLAAKLPNESVEEKGSIPSTPILTTKNFNEEVPEYERDPRSPSKNIARTPIQLLTEAAAELERFQTDNDMSIDADTPIKQPVLLGIDPRSPTTDFERTPIVISASPDPKMPHKIHNKILDKVRKSAILGTPKSTSKKIPPKLLESSPITSKPTHTSKRKSYVGLLETNIDYTETNLDAVIKEKELLHRNLLNDESTSSDRIGIVKDDPRSPTADFMRTPIQVVRNLEDISHNEKSDVLHVEDENNVEKLLNIENTKTPLTVQLDIQTEDCQIQEEILNISEDNDYIEPIYEDSVPDFGNQNVDPELSRNNTHKSRCSKSAPITPTQKSVVAPNQSKSEPVSPPLIDLTADVKELDKKLSDLIYEDNSDLVVCPRVVKLKEQSRTPLSDRNCDVQNKLAPQQKLKVSDKPRKSEYRDKPKNSEHKDKPTKSEYGVSKIPLYKDKTKKLSRKVQCENTPPSNMMVKSKNKSHWDNDSLVI